MIFDFSQVMFDYLKYSVANTAFSYLFSLVFCSISFFYIVSNAALMFLYLLLMPVFFCIYCGSLRIYELVLMAFV